MPNPNRGACGFQSSEFEQEYERPSKSQLKRESTALQKLGQDLIDEPRDRVKRVPMPEDVREAILECQLIKDHEGRRRQLQYVGKKMRTLDEAEIAIIQKTIDSWRGLSKSDTAAMHALERRRDKLLVDDQALTDLLAQHPHLDAQQLRTMIRNARREQADHKPPKAYREIFQLLKQLQAGAAGADAAQDEEVHRAEHDEEHDEEHNVQHNEHHDGDTAVESSAQHRGDTAVESSAQHSDDAADPEISDDSNEPHAGSGAARRTAARGRRT